MNDILIVCSVIFLAMYFVFIAKFNSRKNNNFNFHRQSNVPKLEKMPILSFHSKISSDYVVLDLETTGLNPCDSEILEIGAIKYCNNVECERFHTYIKPCGGINPEAYDVNHISYEMVENAPNIEDIKSYFLSFIKDFVIVGYNVKFDIDFIQTRLQIILTNPFIDVLPMARHWIEGLFNYKLENVKTALGINSASHNVIDDCEATAAVFKYCINLKQKIELEKSPISRVQQPICGVVEPYFNVIKDILQSKYSNLQLYADGTLEELYIYTVNSFVPFCYIKRSGKLKYWLSYSPVEVIEPICNGRFKCCAATKTEGNMYTRIFIDNFNDISTLSEIIFKDYEKSVNDLISQNSITSW
ncbi:MAG: exonuclease domain-containing protein [Christensenellaceae bacterium]